MKRINLVAVCLAFIAEFLADGIIESLMLAQLAHGTLSPDLDQEALKKAGEAIFNSSEFLIGKIVFGTATTIGGGYLAARLAKTYPYYNGLGIGLVGMLYSVIFWGDLVWLNVFAILTTVPASIYGAHLAKKHIPPAE